MNQTSFKRYIWLIDTVYQADKEGITFENICSKWKETELSKGKSYPLRTFHNHRKEIKDVFNVAILCRKSTNSYYISDLTRTDNILKKLLELVAVNQIVDERPEVRDNLVLELHPGGECFLSKAMNAISTKHVLKLEYKPYWSDKVLHYKMFAPYALKEYRGCWYLIGQREASPCEMIDLKNVTGMTTLDVTFVMPSKEDVSSLVNDNFGSVMEVIETEEVMIKVGARFATYLRSNPIHSTQKEIERKRGYSVFYFYLKPNLDFRREILSFGTSVEVLAPQHLRSELAQEAKTISKKNS